MSRNFIKSIDVDNFHLDHIILFPYMNSYSSFFATIRILLASMGHEISAFGLTGIWKFWSQPEVKSYFEPPQSTFLD